MFDFLSGTITLIKEKSVTLQVGGIGFTIHSPNTKNLAINSAVQLYTYLHWNQENGPSLYGFSSDLERKVFLMIIDCPKIGPSIGLNVLNNLTPIQFLDVITSNNEAALSSISGIGAKKAEQIIVELKHKVQKLITSGEVVVEEQGSFAQWQQLSEVLTSLNYSKPEIVKATQYVAEKYGNQSQFQLDQLIRTALSYLSQKQA